MPSLFTDQVRGLDPGRYPDEALWAALRRAVFAKMRDRRLADAPPEYLGYPSGTSWRDEEAVADLLLDAYQYAFLDRRAALLDRLDRPGGGNVDGLIHRNIGNFLTDRQKRHDPFGYAAFKNVEGALLLGIESGSLSLVDPKPGPIRVRNATVVAIAGAAVADPRPGAWRLGEVLDRIEAWRSAIPRIFRIDVRVQRQLQGCWSPLADAGVSSFACGELGSEAKPAAREHGAAWHAAGGGDLAWEPDNLGGGSFVKVVHPPDDRRDSWSGFVDSVIAEIGLIKQARLRDRVEDLFRQLVASAVLRFEGPLPTQADLSRRLGIPTSTVAEAYRKLREIIERLRPKANPP